MENSTARNKLDHQVPLWKKFKEDTAGHYASYRCNVYDISSKLKRCKVIDKTDFSFLWPRIFLIGRLQDSILLRLQLFSLFFPEMLEAPCLFPYP